jgi:dsRNA-specific ribonuclease
MEEIPPEFKFFIEKLLKTAGITKPEQINLLTDDYCMHEFLRAFTSGHFSEDSLNFNYEYYEELGDLAVNKSAVWYFYRRFNFGSNKSLAVKVVSRLRNMYSTSASEAKMARSLGFWTFIRTSEEEKERSERKLLEDVFEAFVGCLEFLVDLKILEHVGYSVVYKFVTKMLEETFGEEFKKYDRILSDNKNTAIFDFFIYIMDPVSKAKELVEKLRKDDPTWNLKMPKYTTVQRAFAKKTDKYKPILVYGDEKLGSDVIEGNANYVDFTLNGPNIRHDFRGVGWDDKKAKANAGEQVLDYLKGMGKEWTYSGKYLKSKPPDIQPYQLLTDGSEQQEE